MRVGFDNALENFSTLVELAELGHSVEIEGRDSTVVRLVAIDSPVANHELVDGCAICERQHESA